IPADLQYSRDTHILTASLELPGVKRDRLRITLGTAYFNKVRYVCVIAESTPSVNRIVNPNLRERRFGLMRRVIQVPETTTLEDIKASLEDGVLTLRIDLGEPYELDDEVEVPIS
ncbi:hypothetical protein CPB84DRAFT_1675319, partial [Gymnopilus junonius]